MSVEIAHETRPMYWSIRRELWENRSIYLVPLAVAGVILFGFVISTFGLPQRRRATLQLPEAKQRIAVEEPYDAAAGILFVTSSLVGVFYCLDALYGERRDRTILFWKSMPVSDRTTVLSKAAIPFVWLPVQTYVIAVMTTLAMLMWSTIVLLGSGFNLATIAPQMRFALSPLLIMYAYILFALWHAPIYAWLLVVSAWAKRAAFIWAVLPFLTIAIFEAIAFQSSHFMRWIHFRLSGCLKLGIITQPGQPPMLTPERFLVAPGLWLGLAFAALCLFAAIRLRRYREPM